MISMRHSAPSSSSRAFTQLACHSASWEPRDPITSIRLFQPEDLSYDGDEMYTFGLGGVAPQLRYGTVRDLVHQAAREGLQRFFLLVRERAEPGAHSGEFGGAEMLELFLQADN